MPKATSKAQQRWFWAASRRRGSGITPAIAKAHSRSGKAFKRLPARKGRKR